MRYFFSILLILFIASGCGLTYRTLLGINHKPQWKSEKAISRDFKKRKIPEYQQYVLDTASYSNLVKAELRAELEALETDTAQLDSSVVKRMFKVANDNLQPVQVRWFNSSGAPIFKLVNCYVDPPIPMRWNVEGSFDTFPPHNDIKYLQLGNKSLGYFLPHLQTADGHPVTLARLTEADYYAVVFWNDFFIRPSKKLIKLLKNYEQEHGEHETHYLFVHNHNAQIWSRMTAEQQERARRTWDEEEK